MDEVISIGSSDGNNERSSFMPPPDKDNRLYAIGEGMKAAWIDSPYKWVRRQGSSYSTPVAAGIAAVVLGCVLVHKKTMARTFQIIRRRRGMLAVFSLMTKWNDKEKRDYGCIRPELLFNDGTDDATSTEDTCSNGTCHILYNIKSIASKIYVD